MNKKTQVVIIVLCLLVAVVVLAYSMGFIGGGKKAPTPKEGQLPRLAPSGTSSSDSD